MEISLKPQHMQRSLFDIPEEITDWLPDAPVGLTVKDVRSLWDELTACHGARTEPLTVTVNAVRDEHMARVADAAEARHEGFAAAAAAFVLQYLDVHGPTAGEVLTLACKTAGITPHDDRAFGPVYMTLARRGAITKVGTVRRERGHGTAGGNIWSR